MDATNTMAKSAAQAVWGDNNYGKEPISGVQGNVPRGEPYDAGNLSEEAQRRKVQGDGAGFSSPQTSPTQHGALDDDESTPNYRHESGAMSAAGHDEKQLNKPTAMPSHDHAPSSTKDQSPAASDLSSSQMPQGSDPNAMMSGGKGQDNAEHAAHSSRKTEHSSSIGEGSGTSHNISNQAERRGDTAATSGNITTSDQSAPETKNDTSLDQSRGSADGSSSELPPDKAEEETGKAVSGSGEADGDPNTGVMGDGPKSLADVAKEHGGDAGNKITSTKGQKGLDSAHEDNSQENKGTGEEIVKATGFAADGGDFDATNPGAGREADRLMEEKGMSHGKDAGHTDEKKDEKPSLGERIKNKLHKH